MFKILKDSVNTFSCNLFIAHCYYHAVNSRKALSFKMLSTEIRIEIEAQFSSGSTPSQACNDFLRSLQSNSEDELNFHLRKADRSKCPRRRYFNSLYIKYCHVEFGGTNGAEMFDKLEERINDFTVSNDTELMTLRI